MTHEFFIRRFFRSRYLGKPMFGRYCVAWLLVLGSTAGCVSTPEEKNERPRTEQAPIERLAGDANVAPTAEELERGRVLMSYSGCFACHKETDRKRGPALTDIAARYPMNSTYIDVLAKRVILGSKGAWGNAVMLPHPKVAHEDAEAMVAYILSLYEGRE